MTYDGAERVSAAELERALAGHPPDCGCSGCAFRNDSPAEPPTPKGVQVSVQPHPLHPETHSIVRVEVRGRVRACTWAGTPTIEEAREAWRTDKKAFTPYDESSGTYL